MRYNKRALWINIIGLLFPVILQAQNMVTSVGSDGLERTVSFNVANFTDIRDKKLEDVLSKMPGISPSEDDDGSYTYNGLVVDKIYIDGKDILEGNYSAIYNMKPEDVDRLEITENQVYMKVMRGKQFSNSASINVITKKDDSLWFGAFKGGLGIQPFLLNTDLTAIRMGNKWQTTLMFKADNTGLILNNTLKGFGGDDADEPLNLDPYSLSGINYSVKNFLDIEPSLAPLLPDRVRNNRSGLINLGTTVQLKNDYQLNFQLLYHTDRLTASNANYTNYYMEGGKTIDYDYAERATNHQNDIQANVTLLSNTEERFLRNNFSFSTQWYDTHTKITGYTFGSMQANNNPLLIKNDFIYKFPLGKNVLTFSANAGFYSRPQYLTVTKEKEGVYTQDITAYSAYAEAVSMLDRRINDRFTLSFNAGLSGNIRQLKTDMQDFAAFELHDVKSDLNAFNVYGGASITYVSDLFEGAFQLPINLVNYTLKDRIENLQKQKSKYFLSPKLTLTYIPFDFLTLNFEGSINCAEHPRMNIYKGLVLSDFRVCHEGYDGFNGSKTIAGKLTASFSWPNSSFFVNAILGYEDATTYYDTKMQLDNQYLIHRYTSDTGQDFVYDIGIDVSKGIESFKGSVGVKMKALFLKTDIERNEHDLPFKNRVISISPYVNGRLNSWWNIVYKLQYVAHRTKMDNDSFSYNFHNYNHSLEMIFSPWRNLDFSILGEHYHTEYKGDISKDLFLFDCMVEYNFTNNLQLILSVKNILNKKNYDLTIEDTDLFSKSFSSYQIRPRNVLLSLYYKF
ncbi:MAG: hypothetical protein K5856_04470 [Bacteroidaceae bacterium]|nr:hypothetical protein [Bacteroidaceae bacterium]